MYVCTVWSFFNRNIFIFLAKSLDEQHNQLILVDLALLYSDEECLDVLLQHGLGELTKSFFQRTIEVSSIL